MPSTAATAPEAPFTVPDLTVPDLLADAVARVGENVALDFLGATTSYRELAQQVDRAAGVLAAAGVRAGDRVALVLPNCPQHVVAFYAVLKLGAVVAEHNPLAAAAELQAQLDAHGATVVVSWEKSLDKVCPDGDLQGRTVLAVDLTAALPLRSRVLLSLPVRAARTQREAMRGPVPDGVLSWEKELRRADPLTTGGAGPRPSDPAVLLHTGGTTGTPKAVVLTHHNLVANVTQSAEWISDLRYGQEVFSAVLPFFHAFGLTLSLTTAVHLGATQVVFPRFDPDMVLAAVRRRPITFFGGVPPMFARLAETAEDRDVDLGSVRYAISGAMSLDTKVAAHWERLTGGLIIEGYGMTETSPVVLGNPLGPERRPGALGLPFPGTRIRVVDPEEPTVDVADGQVGELVVAGPQIFAGYWQDPEATAEVMLDGGWLRTGDLVRRGGDGFVTLADRRKELIIFNGFNIYPSQVEEVVRSMPQVKDVAVVGVPDGVRGERVVAALVLEPGATVDLATVRQWASERLSHYAVPRAIAVLEDLPRSQLGKVLRRSVREQLTGPQTSS